MMIFVRSTFFAPDTWQRIRGEKDPVLQEAEDRAHKQLAHITRSRQRREGWECTAILKTLVPVLKLFLAHARQELIHKAFRSEVESLEKTANRARIALSGTTTPTTFSSTSFVG